jgi:dephospho-CoA kinase
MKIGITGGMGGGKSTVSSILAAELGAVLLNSDEICREQMSPGQRGFIQFVGEFGERFIDTNGSIDRDTLRDAVFTEGTIRKELESILHPLVKEKIEGVSLREAKNNRDVVVEVPLLFEVGWESAFDITVTVRNSLEIAVRRILSRDKLNREMVEKMINSQMPIWEKEAKADFTIDNSSTLTSTVLQLSFLRKHVAVSRDL